MKPARQSLLLVDADPRSARVLEVSLRKAGYEVLSYANADEALAQIGRQIPSLILADTRLPELDGFGLLKAVREKPTWAGIPFVFLSSDPSVESKVRGLELGVEDYLTKPIYIKELLTRVQLVLQRKQREGLSSERAPTGSRTKFTGSLADMGLVDLLTTIDLSRKSGILHLSHQGTTGAIFFRDGKIIDAKLGARTGEAAIYRALVWNEGAFEIDFRAVRRDERITTSTQGILMEGMRRLDEWTRLVESMPPFDAIAEVDGHRVRTALADIPDAFNPVLRQIDGVRALSEIVDAVEGDDLATLQTLASLLRDRIVFVKDPPTRPLRITTEMEAFVPPEARRESGPRTKTLAPPAPVLGANVPDLRGDDADDPSENTPPLGSLPLGLALAESAEVSASGSEGKARTDTPSQNSMRQAALSESTKGSTLRPPAFGQETPPDAVQSKVHDEEAMSKKSKRPKKGTSHAEASVSIPPPAALPGDKENNVIHFPNGGKPKVADTLTKFPPTEPADSGRPTVPSAEFEEHEPQPTKSSGKKSESNPPQKSDKTKKSFDVHDEHAAVHDHFFDSEPGGHHLDTWDDLHTGTHAAIQIKKKRDMRMFAIFGGFCIAAVGGLFFYFKFAGVQPAPVGGGPPVLAPATPPSSPPSEPLAVISEPTVPQAALPSEVSPPLAQEGTDIQPGQTPAEEPQIAPPPPAEEPVAPPPVEEPPPPPPVQEPPPNPIQEPPPPAPAPPTAASPDYETALAAARRARARTAISSWEAALAINPSGTAALSGLAYAHLNARHNREAADFAGRAVASDPTNAQGWLVLGAARAELHDNRGAREAFQSCVAQGRGREVRDCRAMLTIY